jgi:hypothetical protein
MLHFRTYPLAEALLYIREGYYGACLPERNQISPVNLKHYMLRWFTLPESAEALSLRSL